MVIKRKITPGYERTWQPIILRDVVRDLNLDNKGFGSIIGLNQSCVSSLLTRGYIPVKRPELKQRIEDFISRTPGAINWLRRNGRHLTDVWNPSRDKSRFLHTANWSGKISEDMKSAKAEPRCVRLLRPEERRREVGNRNNDSSALEVLAAYGFESDPFEDFRMDTTDQMILKRVLKMAIDGKKMISVVALWGYGKTTGLNLAFEDIEKAMRKRIKVVRLVTPDSERVIYSDIEKALILALSKEDCKRTKEIRARQVRRIVGESSREQSIIIVLDNAHRMHPATLRAVKALREMEWMGTSPLFTVVMTGQFDPVSAAKRGTEEVRLRTDKVVMKGLTQKEVEKYIAGTVGKCFEEDAVEAIGRLEESRNFLELQEVLISTMSRALDNGQRKVSAMEVFEIYGGGLRELINMFSIGGPEMEAVTGLNKSTLSLIINDKAGALSRETVTVAKGKIADLIRSKREALKGKHTIKAVN